MSHQPLHSTGCCHNWLSLINLCLVTFSEGAGLIFHCPSSFLMHSVLVRDLWPFLYTHHPHSSPWLHLSLSSSPGSSSLLWLQLSPGSSSGSSSNAVSPHGMHSLQKSLCIPFSRGFQMCQQPLWASGRIPRGQWEPAFIIRGCVPSGLAPPVSACRAAFAAMNLVCMPQCPFPQVSLTWTLVQLACTNCNRVQDWCPVIPSHTLCAKGQSQNTCSTASSAPDPFLRHAADRSKSHLYWILPHKKNI